VNGSRVEWKPSAARLRELTEKMPDASVTEFGNVNIKARVDSRSTRSTYLVEDFTNSRGQTITWAEYERVAALQDAHIAGSYMVVVDGVAAAVPGWTTSRSSSPAGSTTGRAGPASTRPWWPGSSRSGRNSSAPARAGLDESLVKSLG
jgi:hypothetical protein